ncbi:MAG: Ig-like domain-containing protein [Nitrospira sp.]|nr:Ig-like domain-containing protein [Nitrospira sp.]
MIAIEIVSPGISSGYTVSNTNTGDGPVGGSSATGTEWSSANTKKFTLDAGTSAHFSVVARDVTGNSYDNVKVSWASDNKDIVAVDNTGQVKSKSPGSATITANLTMPDGTTITDTVLVTVFLSPVKDKKWVKNVITMPRAMWDHASAIWNGFLYLSGGNSDCGGNSDYKDCGFSNKVYYATVNPDGSVGRFAIAAEMPVYLRGHSLLAYNGFMYLIGGIVQFPPPCNPADNTCITPDPNCDTSIDPACIKPDPNMYTHGPNETDLNEKVYYAKINPVNGTVGPWQETSPLQLPELTLDKQDKAGLFAHAATIVNGNIYVTGGWNVELKKNVSTVLMGIIDTDGSIKNWFNKPGFDLPYNLSKHAITAINVNGDNYLYVIGGNSGDLGRQVFHSEILYSKLTSDGIPGPWKQASSSLPVSLIDHAAVSLDRHIIVLGGRDGDETSKPLYKSFSNVYSYYVNDLGDLDIVNGNGQPPPPLPVPLFHHAAVADTTSGNIYVSGGTNGDTEDPKNRLDGIYYLTSATP